MVWDILIFNTTTEADLSASKADFLYQKIYKPLNQVQADFHHISDFK